MAVFLIITAMYPAIGSLRQLFQKRDRNFQTLDDLPGILSVIHVQDFGF
jgi:hypothetical protein